MTFASIAKEHYRLTLKNGEHEFYADEPKTLGGGDTAPAPDDLLEASLASCTAITLRMYADRKEWKVDTIEVSVNVERVANNKTVFSRKILFTGDIDAEQKERLLQIAKACPVSKTLLGEIEINSSVE